MPQITDEARSTVYLDGRLAGQELDKLTKQAKQYGEALNKAQLAGDSKGAKQIKADLAGVNKQIKTLDKDAAVVHKTLNNLNGASLNDLEKSFFKLRNHTKKLNTDTAEYKKSVGDMKLIEAQMNKVKGEMKGTSTASGGLVNSLKGMLPALGPAAIVAGFAAITAKVFGMAKALDEARTQVAKLTGAMGDELNSVTAKVQAIATTFDVDFKETLVAANNYAKQMGVDMPTALDAIQKGFAAGANESGEFLAMLREYGPQLKEAGYSAEEAIGMMTQQVKDGVFSDKGIDTIKEATLRIREMTPATKAAIDGIGLNSKAIEKGLADGTLKINDVIAQVSGKLAELPPQSSKVGTAIADIFGGPGEDAGLEYLKTLKNIDGDLDKLVDSSGDFAKKQLELVKVNEAIEASKNRVFGSEGSWFGSLTLGWKKLVLAFMGGLEQFKASFGGLKKQFSAIKEALAPVFGYFKNLLQSIGLFKEKGDAMSATTNIIGVALKSLLLPIRYLVSSIQLVIGAFGDLYTIGKQTWDWIKSGFDSELKPKFDFEGIKKGLSSFKDTFVDTYTNAEKESTDVADKEAENRKKIQDEELKNKKQQLADYNAYQKQKAIEQAAAYSKVEADVLKRLQVMQDEYSQKQLSEHDQKLQAVKNRYQKEIEAAKGHNNLIVQLRELMNKEIADFESEWAAAEDEKKKAAIEKFESDRANLIKQYRKLSADEMQQEEIATVDKSTAAGQELYKDDPQALLDLLEEGEAAKEAIYEKYRLLKAEKDKEAAAKELDRFKNNLATMQALTTMFGDLVQAQKDNDLSKVDARLARDLKLAGNNEDKKKKITEKAEADKINIQKKYADKEFAVQVAQIISSGALAIMQGFAQLGPIGGAIAAVLLGITTGLQLSTANQQRQAVKQLARGKYNVIGEDDGRLYNANYSNRLSTGLVRTPTLVGEEPEIVVDTNTTRNIMQFRPDIYSDIMAMRVPQRAAGKYTAESKANDTETIKQLTISVSRLNTILAIMLQDGVSATISYDLITDAADRMKQIENDTTANNN